jgi:hypothetical protein
MPSCSIQWSSKSLQVLTKSQRDEMLSMPDPVVVESRCGTHGSESGPHFTMITMSYNELVA